MIVVQILLVFVLFDSGVAIQFCFILALKKILAVQISALGPVVRIRRVSNFSENSWCCWQGFESQHYLVNYSTSGTLPRVFSWRAGTDLRGKKRKLLLSCCFSEDFFSLLFHSFITESRAMILIWCSRLRCNYSCLKFEVILCVWPIEFFVRNYKWLLAQGHH